MIRASKHSIKFSNTNKKNNLSVFINEYRKVAKQFIDHIWSTGSKWTYKEEEHEFNLKENKLELPSMLTSDLIEKANIKTFLSGRAMKCCLTQVAGMLKAETEKQRKRLYMFEKRKADGDTKKKLSSLIRRIKENIPKKPDFRKINPELNSICCSFQEIESNEFNGFLRLTSITKDKMDIKIPIKYTRHSKKLMLNGKLKPSFLIRDNSVDFRWEIPDVDRRIQGRIVGADQGMKDVLTLSDKQVTPKTDIHGHSLESIIDRLCRKKKGSRGFRRTENHRENFINWSLNMLNLSGIIQINLERIWNIGYKNGRSRKMSHWTNTIIRDKVESLAEGLGVQVVHQDSTYRSQRCSDCGMVRKSNRKGKVYTCKHCGLIIDSDFNASLNHEIELPEIPYDFRNRKLNRAGFFWLDSGLFDLDGRSLQSLLQIKA